MLKVVLLDQLMIEYLMNVQDTLLEDVAKAEQQHIRLASEREQQRSILENNKQVIDELRDTAVKKTAQLKNHSSMRKQLSAYQCPYCSKMFKNLHFLEKHLIRKELSSLRMEKDAESRIEEQRKKEDQEKAAKNLELQKTMFEKEAEMRQIRDDFAALKAKLEQDQMEKGQIELKLARVNQELTSNLARMEQELREQKNNLQANRPIESTYVTPQYSFGQAQHIQPVQNQIELRQPAPERIISQRLEDSPVNHPQSHPLDVVKTMMNSTITIELINRCIADNAKIGNKLVEEVRTDPEIQKPHPQVLHAIGQMLQENKMDPSNPCVTETSRFTSAKVMDMMAKRLKEVALLKIEEPVQAQPAVKPLQSSNPIGEALQNIAPKTARSIETEQQPLEASTPMHIQQQPKQPVSMNTALWQLLPEMKQPQLNKSESKHELFNQLQARGDIELTPEEAERAAPLFAEKAVAKMLEREGINLEELYKQPIETQLQELAFLRVRHSDAINASRNLTHSSQINYSNFKNPIDHFDSIEPNVDLINKKSTKREVEINIVNFLKNTNQLNDKNKKILEEKNEHMVNVLSEFLLELNYRSDRSKPNAKPPIQGDNKEPQPAKNEETIEEVMNKKQEERATYVLPEIATKNEQDHVGQTNEKNISDASKNTFPTTGVKREKDISPEREEQRRKLKEAFMSNKVKTSDEATPKAIESKLQGVVKEATVAQSNLQENQPKSSNQPVTIRPQPAPAVDKPAPNLIKAARVVKFDDDPFDDIIGSQPNPFAKHQAETKPSATMGSVLYSIAASKQNPAEIPQQNLTQSNGEFDQF